LSATSSAAERALARVRLAASRAFASTSSPSLLPNSACVMLPKKPRSFYRQKAESRLARRQRTFVFPAACAKLPLGMRDERCAGMLLTEHDLSLQWSWKAASVLTCGAGAWSARHWRAALELSSISCRPGEGHSAVRHSATTILPVHLLKSWQHSQQQAQIT
jgi:hypothetical protein